MVGELGCGCNEQSYGAKEAMEIGLQGSILSHVPENEPWLPWAIEDKLI